MVYGTMVRRTYLCVLGSICVLGSAQIKKVKMKHMRVGKCLKTTCLCSCHIPPVRLILSCTQCSAYCVLCILYAVPCNLHSLGCLELPYLLVNVNVRNRQQNNNFWIAFLCHFLDCMHVAESSISECMHACAQSSQARGLTGDIVA